MRSIELARVPQSPPRHGVHRSGRRGLIAAGVAIAVASLAFNWSFLVAAGIAPVLLGLLPCAAMCALGLCMNRMTGRSGSAGELSPRDCADDPKVLSADLKGSD
ncbi:hypothetical protein SAMN03159463_02670 [Mesorhizobium sp. NFR06]|uniref:hypothetical protein n=1 Tax=Mesorhizobium sp. NFR06 TaxID=1566290 RepID=UPI0008E1697D|nr:hypothetical protein [Mesorhizobium sp. NFR06]SFO68289.1 hypothetical protein SAMN03159463_02670 [Mesorhizobium sp. NFR06]